MSKVPKIPAPKDWNKVLAFLEDWRSQTNQVAEGLQMRLEGFEREFRSFRVRAEADLERISNGLAENAVDLRSLKNDNATFLARLSVVENKVGLA